MPNYQLGKIYKLSSPSANIVYYGSTCEKYISTRLAKHRSDYKHYLNNKGNNKGRYTYSFKVLECEDYKIELLEKYPCNNVDQLETRERWYIENNECVNKVIPTRTKKEWEQDNREYILEQRQEYRTNNKDKLNARASQKIVCQCGCQIRRNHIARHIKTKKHLDLVQNKDTIDKVVCECGCQIGKYGLIAHKKTQKHINLMAVD